MRLRLVTATLLTFGLVATGCGWKPPSAPPPEPDKCAAADGPAGETVTTAINALPPAQQGAWRDVARGHTKNCQLYWVQVSAGSDPNAPQHLLFFHHGSSIGTATPEPKPYTTVLGSGEDAVTVNYQFEAPGDVAGQPTGIGQVDYKLGDDGKLKAWNLRPN